MKRILLAAAILAVGFSPAIAQVKVDVDGLKSKIAKSDADIANPKKNAKAATWLDRGKTMLEVAAAPSTGAYTGMDEKSAQMMFGKPVGEVKTQKVGDQTYRVRSYENLRAYYQKDGDVYKMKFWVPTLEITADPIAKAGEAYLKAYSLDAGTAAKVKEGLNKASNEYKQAASNDIALENYKAAAAKFAASSDLQSAAPLNYTDTLVVFNAGFLYVASNEFEKGEKYLLKALEVGYYADGDTYYYLYHCYNGLKEIAKAKDILMQGLAKFPENSKIVEGLLVVYTQGEGDPKDIIPVVQASIEKDPKNPSLYSGLGLIYDKLGDSDKAIEAFAQAAQLLPKDYSANFNLGLLYIKKGDKLNAEFNKNVYHTREEYEAELAKVNKVYAESLPALEKALSLKPGDPAAIELLKNLSIRLRDMPGGQERADKYKAMYDALPQQ